MEIGQKIKKGLFWSSAMQVMTQGIGYIAAIVLARFLFPSDYGIVAMITVFTSLANIFLDFGFSSALIRQEEVTDHQWSTVFFMNLTLGLTLFTVFYFGAPLMAAYYQDNSLILLTQVISINFFINSIGRVHAAQLAKNLDFKRIAFLKSISVTVAAVVAIAFAYLGYGYWSLVAQGLILNALNSVFLWFSTPWKPTFRFIRGTFRYAFNFGGKYTLNNVIGYIPRNLDDLLLAKLSGPVELGLYSKSYSMMVFPLINISTVITRVIFPAFSAIQSDIARVKKQYLLITKAISLLTFPMMFGIWAIADIFTVALLGENWEGMIPILEWLSILGAFQSILTLSGTIYSSMNRMGLALKLSIFSNLIIVSGIVIGILNGGLMGLVKGYFFATLINFFPIYLISGNIIGVKMIDFVRNHWKILTSTAIMAVIVRTLNLGGYLLFSHYIYKLIVLIGIGIVLYLFFILILREKIVFYILENIKNRGGGSAN